MIEKEENKGNDTVEFIFKKFSLQTKKVINKYQSAYTIVNVKTFIVFNPEITEQFCSIVI